MVLHPVRPRTRAGRRQDAGRRPARPPLNRGRAGLGRRTSQRRAAGEAGRRTARRRAGLGRRAR